MLLGRLGDRPHVADLDAGAARQLLGLGPGPLGGLGARGGEQRAVVVDRERDALHADVVAGLGGGGVDDRARLGEVADADRDRVARLVAGDACRGRRTPAAPTGRRSGCRRRRRRRRAARRSPSGPGRRCGPCTSAADPARPDDAEHEVGDVGRAAHLTGADDGDGATRGRRRRRRPRSRPARAATATAVASRRGRHDELGTQTLGHGSSGIG